MPQIGEQRLGAVRLLRGHEGDEERCRSAKQGRRCAAIAAGVVPGRRVEEHPPHPGEQAGRSIAAPPTCDMGTVSVYVVA